MSNFLIFLLLEEHTPKNTNKKIPQKTEAPAGEWEKMELEWIKKMKDKKIEQIPQVLPPSSSTSFSSAAASCSHLDLSSNGV